MSVLGQVGGVLAISVGVWPTLGLCRRCGTGWQGPRRESPRRQTGLRQLARYRLGAIRQDVGDGLVVTALGGAAVQERHAVVVDADDVEVVPVHVLPDEGGIGEGLPSGQVSGAYLQLGGYRTLVLSRSSQCVTVRVVIGVRVMP